MKNQLKSKPLFEDAKSVKKKLDNLILNNKRGIDKCMQHEDEVSLSLFDSYKSKSVENLSKVGPASTKTMKTINRSKKNSLMLTDDVISSVKSYSPSSDKDYTSISKMKYNRALENHLISEVRKNSSGELKINGIDKCENIDSPLRRSINSYGSTNSGEMFSNDFIIKGEIQLKIELNQFPATLKIKIIECRNLSIANSKENTTNPYIKIYLLPDKTSSGKRKTTIKRNTTCPVYNEDLTYNIDRNSLSERTINVSVWHRENLSTNIFMGELNISLNNVRFNDSHGCWYSLKTQENIPQVLSLYRYRGEILIGLQFILNTKKKDSVSLSTFNTGNFLIFLKNGKHIGNEKNIPSAFVKCNVMHNSLNIGKRETKVVSNTTNPIWNEIFKFEDIEKDGLKESRIEITIYNKKFRKTEALGILLLTNICSETNVTTCREKDVLLWRKFLGMSDKGIIEEYLPIRSITE